MTTAVIFFTLCVGSIALIVWMGIGLWRAERTASRRFAEWAKDFAARRPQWSFKTQTATRASRPMTDAEAAAFDAAFVKFDEAFAEMDKVFSERNGA